MLGFIALLLVVWLALVVIGVVIEGLFWLVVVGAVLFVATAAVGWVRRHSGTRVKPGCDASVRVAEATV